MVYSQELNLEDILDHYQSSDSTLHIFIQSKTKNQICDLIEGLLHYRSPDFYGVEEPKYIAYTQDVEAVLTLVCDYPWLSPPPSSTFLAASKEIECLNIIHRIGYLLCEYNKKSKCDEPSYLYNNSTKKLIFDAGATAKFINNEFKYQYYKIKGVEEVEIVRNKYRKWLERFMNDERMVYQDALIDSEYKWLSLNEYYSIFHKEEK